MYHVLTLTSTWRCLGKHPVNIPSRQPGSLFTSLCRSLIASQPVSVVAMPVPQPLKLLYDNAAKENSILPAVDLERFGIYEIGPGLAEAFDSMPISTVERLVLGPVSQLNKDGWSEILQQLQRDDASYRPPCDFDCSERVYQVVWGETQSCKYRMPEDDISYAIS